MLAHSIDSTRLPAHSARHPAGSGLCRRIVPALLVFGCLAGGATARGADESLRVVGSTTVNPVVAEAAEVLRERKDRRITVDTFGGSSGGIRALGDGRADLAMSSRHIKASDRERAPGVDYNSHKIGADTISIVVSDDVWKGGVRALSRRQMRAVFEKKARNWSEFGGPDKRIVFFNKEPGRGTWEVFTNWLYGPDADPPRVNHRTVGANNEVRSKVTASPGAVSFVSTPWAREAADMHALGLRSGTAVQTPGDPVNYPLSRPLFLISDGEPSEREAELIRFFRTPEGRAIIRKHGFRPLPEE